MIEPKNNGVAGIILIAIFGLIALGVWTASRPSTGSVTGVLPGLGQSSVKVDMANNTNQATVQPIKTDGTYTLTDNNEKGIDINVESKSPFKMTLPTSLNTPVTITLGDNKTIEIVQKDGAEYSTGVKGNTVETTENANLLAIIEKDPTLATYASADNKKTIFYSYQKTEGEQKQWLFKNWTLYNTQTNKTETVSYEMRNALVNIDALGNANVYFDDKTVIGNKTPDFTIPRPYILDKDAKKTDLMWTFDATSHTLAVSFSALASSYPIALDPSVLKTDTVIATFSGKTICMNYSCGPLTVPDAPTIGTATQTGATTATVSFTAPVKDGRTAITMYTAYPSSGTGSGTLSQAGSGTITVTGLTTGTAYTFTVKATNSEGLSAASSASNSVTPSTVPGAPTIGTATQTGVTTATVAFTAPASNGGSIITSYTATSSPGNITGTLSQAGTGTITVTGLTGATSYTFTVKATNSVGEGPASSASNSITTAYACGTATVTDIDSNTYNTVLIGSQCWTKENMMTTKYPDGTSIARGPTGATWSGDNAYYAYPPNTANNAEESLANIQSGKLGFVYQWSAVMKSSVTPGAQGICPTNWHVPTDQEYMTMEESLGMCTGTGAGCSGATGWRGTDQGSKLSTETSGGTNSSGFTAHLAGYRGTGGGFLGRGTGAYLWSSTPSGVSAWYRGLNSGDTTVGRSAGAQALGFSVRCLRN